MTAPAVRRIAALTRLEWRLELHAQIPTVAAAVCVMWTVALAVVPASVAGRLGTAVLVLDTATFGGFFLPALFLGERTDGALAALLVSPLRFAEYLGVRLAVLTGLSLAAAVPVGLAAARLRPPQPALALLGVGLVAILTLLLAFALVQPHRTLVGYLTTAPMVIAPLLAAPLAHIAGVADHPLLYALPTTGGADLIAAGLTGGALTPAAGAAATGYLLLWIGGAYVLARRRFHRHAVQAPATRPARVDRTRRIQWRGGWVVTFARADMRTARLDLLPTFLTVVPVALAVGIRFGYPWLADLVRDRAGFDLEPYRQLLLTVGVVIHVPLIMGMVGALLTLDDVAERRLQLLRVTPVTLERYLGYRMAFTGLLALASLLVAVPLCGLVPNALPALLPAIVLGAAQAPLIMLTAAAFAGDRTQGVGILKVLSGLLLLLAVAPWWLPSPLRWLGLLTPPGAVTLVQWRPHSAADVVIGCCVGATTALAVAVTLRRRIVRRFTDGA
ncbi:fluoroquinolone export ABC transporter permease subunit [Phytohabitans sp. LJ34]|uniref:fluoroquinolone export ABC transporter permease subunit n=1 Tax=Phytohabitans sp. LJ34 TaxID=3452217 RepID=UPI003F8BB5E6